MHLFNYVPGGLLPSFSKLDESGLEPLTFGLNGSMCDQFAKLPQSFQIVYLPQRSSLAPISPTAFVPLVQNHFLSCRMPSRKLSWRPTSISSASLSSSPSSTPSSNSWHLKMVS